MSKSSTSSNSLIKRVKNALSTKVGRVIIVSLLIALFPLVGFFGLNYGLNHWAQVSRSNIFLPLCEGVGTAFIFSLGYALHAHYHNESKCKGHFYISLIINMLCVAGFIAIEFFNIPLPSQVKSIDFLQTNWNIALVIFAIFGKSGAKYVNDFKRLRG